MIPQQRSRKRRLVVVGNGMAGARAVEEILARGGGEQFDVVMFGAEPYGNYNRIMLSHVLSGEEEESGIFLNSLPWYEENGIELRAGVPVTHVDRFAKVVHDAEGGSTPYDVLLLATGSTPFMPTMNGAHRPDGTVLDGVFSFRTLDDTRAMLACAKVHRKAVVIGGGLLGLEAAYGLIGHGVDVEVVHSPAHLMNQQLNAEAGRVLRRTIEGLGITVHTGVRTSGLRGDDRVSGVELADGRVLDADFVVVTAGIRPSTSVALRSGIEVERGIVVDDQLRCSADEDGGVGAGDVYAIGECVQHRGQTYGLVAPLWEQAGVLADQLTGVNPAASYHGSRTTTKLKVAGVDVVAMGLRAPERDDDEFVVFSEPHRGVYLNVVIREGRLVGATLLGDVRKTAFLSQAFDQGLPLPEERMSLLFDLGSPGEDASVAELSDDAQVCNCNGVSKGDICGAVAAGATSTGAVMNATRAGKGCGSCKTLVEQITEWAAGGSLTVDESASWYVPGVPLAKPELMAAIRERGLKSVSAVFRELAPGGAEDAKSKMGLTSLLRMMWPEGLDQDERDGRFINDRVHANIQRDGTFSVVPQMKGGVTTVEQLRIIADVAEKYDVGMIKVTGGQRLDLLGLKKEDLPKVWADLGMPSGYAYGKSFRTVKTCVGTDFCRFGLGDSTKLGIDIETRFQGIEAPAKLKLAVVGCPRNCAEAYVKDVGVVAIGNGRWEIYVGGAAGASIRKGDLLATVDSTEEVVRLTGRFIQFYREWGNWLERTYDFVPRLGIERVRAVVVDDSDGLAAGLDERMQAAVDAYVDPWQEGAAPAVPGQFRTSLPLVDLPRVPSRPAFQES
ncbi:nitrite reductase large subunit NirB [Kineococcus gynurae]|uniref:assimilatory sulfite reductase (ferredoxin) n=1 Tax=Kineococcus gynurae TaxID=452979 RepID=A0ABV5LP37_9ACTN